MLLAFWQAELSRIFAELGARLVVPFARRSYRDFVFVWGAAFLQFSYIGVWASIPFIIFSSVPCFRFPTNRMLFFALAPDGPVRGWVVVVACRAGGGY